MTRYGPPADSLFAHSSGPEPRKDARALAHKHQHHRMHENSVEAWREHDSSEREREVLNALDRLGPATDRQIMRALGANDMNYVRPAITRLIDVGVVYEYDRVQCSTTGRTVRRSWLTQKGVRQ